MSIWQRAVETYDCHSSLAGVYEIGKVPLAPISHIVKKSFLIKKAIFLTQPL